MIGRIDHRPDSLAVQAAEEAEHASRVVPAAATPGGADDTDEAVVIGLSAEARATLDAAAGPSAVEPSDDAGPADLPGQKPAVPVPEDRLDPDQRAEVARLRAQDARVRARKMAQLAAAGAAAGVPVFETVTGPDGRRYAVRGRVELDARPAEDPRETLERARRLRAAALAGSDPTQAADDEVAREAARLEMDALVKLATAGARGDEEDAAPTAATDATGAGGDAVGTTAGAAADPTGPASLGLPAPEARREIERPGAPDGPGPDEAGIPALPDVPPVQEPDAARPSAHERRHAIDAFRQAS